MKTKQHGRGFLPTRRQLFQGVAGVLATSSLASAGLWRRRRAIRLGTVLGAGRVEIGLEERNVFCIFDLDDPEAGQRVIPLDFFGHGVATDPLDANRVILFEKKGKGACELDLASGSVTRPIATHADRDFYGHGAFSPDGSLLYATESVISDQYSGAIVVRDGRTLQELGVFPSFGARPHDCVLRDDGKTLVVTNGGGRRPTDGEPCVTYVDVPSQRLIEKVLIPSPEFNAGHLALTSRGDLAVVSASAGGVGRDGLGAASFRPAGEPGRALEIMEEPVEITGRMRGEALSVAIHEPTGVVGITSPFSSLVTFWDLKRSRFLKSLDLAHPRGVGMSLDKSRFVVSYGRSSSLVEVSAETLEPIGGSRQSGLNMVSSHIVIHRLV